MGVGVVWILKRHFQFSSYVLRRGVVFVVCVCVCERERVCVCVVLWSSSTYYRTRVDSSPSLGLL